MLVIVIGSIMCTNDEITVGAFLAFISYNAYLISPIRQLGRTLSEMSKASVSLERISDIMSACREEKQPDALRPDMHGDIEFSHVSFYYEAGKEVLHDINFKMKQGSVLGILGGTGSGKTTMMLLLDKLYAPQKGSIKINGTDIQNINTGYLRSNIGMVLQEPFLFSRSIKDNIALANENASFEEIREAARTACFDDTVMSFLNGYDTFVGERGVTLSGGQKQRANIARMILQKAPIMVFDDSLSAVDTQTDEKIRHRLKRHFKNASVIIISHRINTLSSADKILVLENGSIVEQGTHDELKHANGPYSEIYRLQSAMGRVEE